MSGSIARRDARPSFSSRAAGVISGASAHAASLGVSLDMDANEGRIVFAIARGSAPKGSGAAVVSHMLALADEADVPVVLDVAGSEPALVRYWWRFGFRLVDGDAAAEEADLAELSKERDRFLSDPRHAGETHPVTTMFRDRFVGPLHPAGGPDAHHTAILHETGGLSARMETKR